jgi:hypothetical protein
MPYGGNDWLALTQEPTVEPEIAICDPHHHFWDHRIGASPTSSICFTSWLPISTAATMNRPSIVLHGRLRMFVPASAEFARGARPSRVPEPKSTSPSISLAVVNSRASEPQ